MTPVSGAGSAMCVAENVSCGLTKYYEVSDFTFSAVVTRTTAESCQFNFLDISTDSSGSRNQENDFFLHEDFLKEMTPNKDPQQVARE